MSAHTFYILDGMALRLSLRRLCLEVEKLWRHLAGPLTTHIIFTSSITRTISGMSESTGRHALSPKSPDRLLVTSLLLLQNPVPTKPTLGRTPITKTEPPRTYIDSGRSITPAVKAKSMTVRLQSL